MQAVFSAASIALTVVMLLSAVAKSADANGATSAAKHDHTIQVVAHAK